jgi:hypothetical protein
MDEKNEAESGQKRFPQARRCVPIGRGEGEGRRLRGGGVFWGGGRHIYGGFLHPAGND